MNKEYLLIASFLILVSSCGSATKSTTPQQQPVSSNSIYESVNNYIETLSKQPESGGGKYRCVQDISESRFNRIPNIQEWQITGTSASVDKDDPDSISTDVYVKITRDLNGEKITNTWIATAWKTSDLLQHNLRSLEYHNEVIKQSNAVLGKTTSQKTIPITIDKSGYSPETFCVTGIKKAYKY